jgi:hypothetical protein
MFAIRQLPILLAAASLAFAAHAGQPSDSAPTSNPNPAPPPGRDATKRDPPAVPQTGAPGRTHAAPGATNRYDVDPLFKRNQEPHIAIPQGDGKPASQGPGDAVGKSVPERPTQDRKFP